MTLIFVDIPPKMSMKNRPPIDLLWGWIYWSPRKWQNLLNFPQGVYQEVTKADVRAVTKRVHAPKLNPSDLGVIYVGIPCLNPSTQAWPRVSLVGRVLVNHRQWSIQDFPDGWGGRQARRGRQPIIWPIFPANCMKMKNFGPEGARLSWPLDPPITGSDESPLVLDIFVVVVQMFSRKLLTQPKFKPLYNYYVTGRIWSKGGANDVVPKCSFRLTWTAFIFLTICYSEKQSWRFSLESSG